MMKNWWSPLRVDDVQSRVMTQIESCDETALPVHAMCLVTSELLTLLCALFVGLLSSNRETLLKTNNLRRIIIMIDRTALASLVC